MVSDDDELRDWVCPGVVDPALPANVPLEASGWAGPQETSRFKDSTDHCSLHSRNGWATTLVYYVHVVQYDRGGPTALAAQPDIRRRS